MSSASILYYSDCTADGFLLRTVRRHLRKVSADVPIVSVTLKPTEDWGADKSLVLDLQRGYLAMSKQILSGLLLSESDFVFFCEHDCLYPPSYFAHRPSSDRVYSYAGHSWKVDAKTGRTLHYHCEQVSGLCANRDLVVDHYRRRVQHIETHGFSMRLGFEPGKPVRHGGLDDIPRETWWNTVPIVDIRHGQNTSKTRWSKSEFRNQKYTAGWTESDGVPGWGMTRGRFDAFLREVAA